MRGLRAEDAAAFFGARAFDLPNVGIFSSLVVWILRGVAA
jgi:hypothetical protein